MTVFWFTVLGLSDSENVSTTVALAPVPTVPLPGVTDVAVGATVSVIVESVVNWLKLNCRLLPARSRMAPLLLTRTLIVAPGG